MGEMMVKAENVAWWQLQAAINIARVCRANEGAACAMHIGHVKALARDWAELK